MDIARSLQLAGIGLVAGTWGALIGAGGGFIMVPLLLLFDPALSAAKVTAASLVAVFATGLSGTTVYARLRRIDYLLGALFLAATLPGGVLGALAVNHIPRGLFQVLFGGLLSLVALYIFARPRYRAPSAAASRGARRRLVDSTGVAFEYRADLRLGLAVTSVAGFLSGMLGVGGGIFAVPAFVYLLHIPIHVATATTQFMMVGTTLVANATNILEGDLGGLWDTALALTAGTVVGAQVGARLSRTIGSVRLSRVLAAALLVAGLRLAYNGIATP
ncbi:MAG: sulfite exporter TauE/SafE family protein [Chloroflexi bacterium]|nr:sulfite exporter TauE/SafE family protein [Chloroflexota bacterium]